MCLISNKSAVGMLEHDVSELVHSVKIGILARNHLSFVPNLVNAIFSKIAHEHLCSSVDNYAVAFRFRYGALGNQCLPDEILAIFMPNDEDSSKM